MSKPEDGDRLLIVGMVVVVTMVVIAICGLAGAFMLGGW